MKKLFAILSIGTLLSSCSKTENKEINTNNSRNDSLKTEKAFVIDSVRVQDSLKVAKTLTLSFEKQVLVFPD